MTTKISSRLLYLCIPIAVLFIAAMNVENAYPQGVYANASFSSLGAELLLPATRTPTNTPTPIPTNTSTPSPTPSSSTVTIEGNIYYTAFNEELATSVTNPLARVRIEVWDDPDGVLGETWAEDACPTCNAGHYSITVPNNEPGGIDPFLKIHKRNGKRR